MAGQREITVPDIGDFDAVEVIEVLVEPGTEVAEETPLITLESDKATMEIPSPAAGTVAELRVKVGDKVSTGDPILTLEEGDGEPAPPGTGAETQTEQPARADPGAQPEPDAQPGAGAQPEPRAQSDAGAQPEQPAQPDTDDAPTPVRERESEPSGRRAPPVPADEPGQEQSAATRAHASPAVRRFARELGVDLGRIPGSGRKERILKEDVQAFVKQHMRAGGPAGPAPAPAIDFSRFGPVESRPLSKIRRLTGQNLQRSWLSAPHVTQFDEADVTALEEFRRQQREAAAGHDVKLTLLAFLLKASVAALQRFPQFNASLGEDGETLVLKQYYHLGFAADTPEGLLVPVIRDVDRKGLFAIAAEIQELSAKARERKLSPAQMQGGTFTISSLGGVGGTAFTPIINVPEVAILGVSRTQMRPIYRDGKFVARLMLPLSLSYDHRVIDGVAGARFTAFLAEALADLRTLLL